MQEFNRGLFDFLIATDDSGRQEAGKAASAAADRDASENNTALSNGDDASQEAADDPGEEAVNHEWAAPASNAQIHQVMADCVSLTTLQPRMCDKGCMAPIRNSLLTAIAEKWKIGGDSCWRLTSSLPAILPVSAVCCAMWNLDAAAMCDAFASAPSECKSKAAGEHVLQNPCHSHALWGASKLCCDVCLQLAHALQVQLASEGNNTLWLLK